MATVSIEDAQARLPELIEHLAAGEQLVSMRGQKPIARLLAEEQPKRAPRRAGSAKGMLTILVEDDEHLKDFSEYVCEPAGERHFVSKNREEGQS